MAVAGRNYTTNRKQTTKEMSIHSLLGYNQINVEKCFYRLTLLLICAYIAHGVTNIVSLQCSGIQTNSWICLAKDLDFSTFNQDSCLFYPSSLIYSGFSWCSHPVLLMFRGVWPAHVGTETPRPVPADTDSFFSPPQATENMFMTLKLPLSLPFHFYVHMKYSWSFFSLSPLDPLPFVCMSKIGRFKY